MNFHNLDIHSNPGILDSETRLLGPSAKMPCAQALIRIAIRDAREQVAGKYRIHNLHHENSPLHCDLALI